VGVRKNAMREDLGFEVCCPLGKFRLSEFKAGEEGKALKWHV